MESDTPIYETQNVENLTYMGERCIITDKNQEKYI